MSGIVGKKIVSASLNVDNDELCLVDDKGQHHWLSAVGDCCSKSWFEHITFPTFPFVVKEAICVKWDFEPRREEVDDDEGRDDLKIYALKFKTSKGHIDLELRNQSNGFYGGSIAYSLDLPVDQYNHKHPVGKMRDISVEGL